MKKSFRHLFVWVASVELAVRMIALADRLIARKRYALADQLVRAACSVPNNIAEGQGEPRLGIAAIFWCRPAVPSMSSILNSRS